jgi:hypothetical protein
METLSISIGEILLGAMALLFSLALPLGILFFLYKIYSKLKSIEEQLKKH